MPVPEPRDLRQASEVLGWLGGVAAGREDHRARGPGVQRVLQRDDDARRLAAVGHSLTASCMHTASDVFVILKAGRPARVARHGRALPLIIDPCPDK